MLKRVEQRFKFGSFGTGEFKYTGIYFKQWDDGSIEYDQIDSDVNRKEPCIGVSLEHYNMLLPILGLT